MQIRFLLVMIIALGLAGAKAEPELKQNLASTVLTPELAERILGVELEAGKPNQESDSALGKMRVSHCSYRATGKNRAYIDFVLRQTEDSDAAKQQFEGAKTVLHGKDVAGVGDAAFQPATVRQLHARKGRYYIVVSAETAQRTEGLTEKAAGEILLRLY